MMAVHAGVSSLLLPVMEPMKSTYGDRADLLQHAGTDVTNSGSFAAMTRRLPLGTC